MRVEILYEEGHAPERAFRQAGSNRLSAVIVKLLRHEVEARIAFLGASDRGFEKFARRHCLVADEFSKTERIVLVQDIPLVASHNGLPCLCSLRQRQGRGRRGAGQHRPSRNDSGARRVDLLFHIAHPSVMVRTQPWATSFGATGASSFT